MITLSDDGDYVTVHTIRGEAGALPVGARVHVDVEDLENFLAAGAIEKFEAPAHVEADDPELEHKPEPAHES